MVGLVHIGFFLCKQKTAYEMRISDWSSDVCSSDLRDLWWMQSHAMIPTLDMLGDGLLRVYFSGRNERNVSHIGWAEIDLARPTEIQDYSREPVLLPGALGCFDDNGVTPSSVVRHDGKIYL